MSNVIDITKDLEVKMLLEQNRKLIVSVAKLRNQLVAVNHANLMLIQENEALKTYNELFLTDFGATRG